MQGFRIPISQHFTLLILFFFLTSYADVIYITKPEVYVSLGLSYPDGSLSNPFISLSDVLNGLSNDIQYDIYVSPHNHILDCFPCFDCPDGCEILRGGNPPTGPKNIIMKGFECQDTFQNASMCFQNQGLATIHFSRPEVVIKLQGDSLTINNLQISGELLLPDPSCISPCEQHRSKNIMSVQQSNLTIQNSSIQQFSLQYNEYLKIENSFLYLESVKVQSNEAFINGQFLFAKDSLVTIIDSNFNQNK